MSKISGPVIIYDTDFGISFQWAVFIGADGGGGITGRTILLTILDITANSSITMTEGAGGNWKRLELSGGLYRIRVKYRGVIDSFGQYSLSVDPQAPYQNLAPEPSVLNQNMVFFRVTGTITSTSCDTDMGSLFGSQNGVMSRGFMEMRISAIKPFISKVTGYTASTGNLQWQDATPANVVANDVGMVVLY